MGADFSWGKVNVTPTVGSNAASYSSRADAVTDFCCIQRSSDSQCFSVGRTTPEHCTLPLQDLEWTVMVG